MDGEGHDSSLDKGDWRYRELVWVRLLIPEVFLTLEEYLSTITTYFV